MKIVTIKRHTSCESIIESVIHNENENKNGCTHENCVIETHIIELCPELLLSRYTNGKLTFTLHRQYLEN